MKKNLLTLLTLALLPLAASAQIVVSSTGYETSRVISTGPGTLLSLKGYNSGTTQFIQVLDTPRLGASAAEVTKFVLTGTGGALAGKHILFSTPATDFYAWFKTSDSTTQVVTVTLSGTAGLGSDYDNKYFLIGGGTGSYYVPFLSGTANNPSVSGRTKVAVSITGTDTTTTIATAAAAALDALDEFVSTSSSNVITITSAAAGPATGFPDAGTSGASVILTTRGRTVTLGSDPAVPNRTGTSVVVSATNTATQCATAAATAIGDLTGLDSTSTSGTLTVTNTGTGYVLNRPGAGTSGATVTISTPGVTVPTVPVLSFTAAATSNFDAALPPSGITFSRGITVATSTNGATLATGGTDCFFTAAYK